MEKNLVSAAVWCQARVEIIYIFAHIIESSVILHTHTHKHMFMCAQILYRCTYTNTHKHTQTHTNTHKHTQTHTHTHIHTQTHTHTDTYTRTHTHAHT